MSRNGKLAPYAKGVTWSQKVRNMLDISQEGTQSSSVDQFNSNSQESEDDEELIMSSQPQFVPPKPKRYFKTKALPPSVTNFEEPGMVESPPNSKKSRVASTSSVHQINNSNQNDANEIQRFLQANDPEVQQRQKILLDLQIEEKKVDLEIKRTQLEKEQLQCRELKLKIEQLEKNQNV